MYDLATIKHMNQPEQVEKIRALALALNRKTVGLTSRIKPPVIKGSTISGPEPAKTTV